MRATPGAAEGNDDPIAARVGQSGSQAHADVHRFARLLTARRLLRDVEPERRRESLNHLLPNTAITWHGVTLGQPDWSDASHSVAFTAEIRRDRLLFHVILNAYWEPLEFELPPVPRAGPNPWRRWIDTARDAPQDIVPWMAAAAVIGHRYRAEARSVVGLFADVSASLDQGADAMSVRSA